MNDWYSIWDDNLTKTIFSLHFCSQKNKMCPYANKSGYCAVTGCINHDNSYINHDNIYINNVKINYVEN